MIGIIILHIEVLRAAATSNSTDTWWWINGDGCDVVKGICESTRGEWSGDVDLNDGHLKDLQKRFKEQLQWTEGIGLGQRSDSSSLKDDLTTTLDSTSADLQFIHSGKCLLHCMNICTCLNATTFPHDNMSELQKAQSDYEEKLQDNCSSEQTMFALSWDIKELTQILIEVRGLHGDIAAALDVLSSPATSQQELNLPRMLCFIRKKRTNVITRITRFRRKPATHIFALMISTELRNQKPYALPVQCVPYAGLKEVDIRMLINKLVMEMVALGMKVAGIISYTYLLFKL